MIGRSGQNFLEDPLNTAHMKYENKELQKGRDERSMPPDLTWHHTIRQPDMELVWINPGEFLIGSPEAEGDRAQDEGPQTRVTLSQGFWLGKFQVTQAQWEIVMRNNPCQFKGSRLPVETVSWTEAMAFCGELTEREHAQTLPKGYVYTLPTEAQWEFACRATTLGPYAGDGQLDNMGWYRENSHSRTQPVGQKSANAWGLFDMHGNVWEWCADWFGDYPGGHVCDPVGPAFGVNRVCRGGGWASIAGYCRSAYRDWFDANSRGGGLGFRIALVPQIKP
jgi:formylglycine-generating enzyme required for sulfatase activity